MLIASIEKNGSNSSTLYSEINGFFIGLKESKKHLESAKKIHDDVLAKYGPYSFLHRCDIHPFATDTENSINKQSQVDSVNYILERDTVYSLSLEEQMYRKALGRQRWTEPSVTMNLTMSNSYLGRQTELLCKGRQLRVKINRKQHKI